ncbi:probable ADP-ribosylation factor GTPase-activating protein AGD14 [Impatiens glandulifera]|uniref:probable ADP-ribosylation factor GTPase-activating protein AGD14 n=1 Tax=Impatiens glandulifera TaxID=253017 RepID=UPI001FB188F1|nr:probable ADP-ribosylation factor GTPase-activating protein AGD14 [Impatiens glandulifera]
MTSKREEERNEKIIRGLMKLPPNRRCINCNGLGPQYVCTNFWTFICMACSGIHREFTHRVKSVSMSKFSSQEVEALEKGGNQRARETYLRDWDPQRQRLPDNSNAEKVREFIKNVYVDRKYATGKPSDKPPRDAQNFRIHEDETRRASSYHSYSQSPPYDNQYEDRIYGRPVHALTRRPGSDRSLYEGKVSSFSSPSRLSDQLSEDRFANEEPNNRVSDYSVSMSGDPFRTHPLSPNFQRNTGSPSSQTSGDTFSEDSRHHIVSSFTETNSKMDPNGLPRPQRTASTGNFGSFDRKSMPFKSVSSIDLFNIAPQHEQPAGIYKSDGHDVSSLMEPSTNRDLRGLDLFHTTAVTQNIASNTAIDFFQLPGAPKAPHADLFQPPSSSVREVEVNQASISEPPSDTFSGKVTSLPIRTSLDEAVIKNEGWATFDTPHHLPDPSIKDAAQGVSTSVAGNHVGKMDPHLSPNTNLQWSAFGDNSIHGSSPVSNLWHEDLNSFQVSYDIPTQPWDATFKNSTEHFPPGNIHPGGKHVDVLASDVSHYMGAGGPQSHGIDCRSTNPFDLPYDTDLEPSNMFLDMNSLQTALSSESMSNSYIDVMGGQPWFSQNTVVPQDPSQGSLAFIGGEVSSTQLPNVSAQGPVASVGGNPFA